MQTFNEYRIHRTHPDKPEYDAPNWWSCNREESAIRILARVRDEDTYGYEYRIERRTVTTTEWTEVDA